MAEAGNCSEDHGKRIKEMIFSLSVHKNGGRL